MVDQIRPDRWALAWLAQTGSRLKGPSKHPSASRPVTSSQITVPTRHGAISALIYRSTGGGVLAGDHRTRPPLHIQIHGGGMIGRAVREDEHICRYLASETGCIVLSLHYHTAPQVTFPVAEEECFDALAWAASSADQFGWDRHRITVGGGSTGAKLAINTAQQAYDTLLKVSGLIATTPILNFAQNDRHVEVEVPKYGPRILQFVADTYFTDATAEPLASPAYDLALVKKLPPILIQGGQDDWLVDDSRALAARLAKANRPHTLTEYPAGHEFTVRGDTTVMAEAIREQGRFLLDLY